MKNNEINKKQPDFVIYTTDDDTTKVSVRIEEETVWLAQKQLAEIFDTTRENVVQHIRTMALCLVRSIKTGFPCKKKQAEPVRIKRQR